MSVVLRLFYLCFCASLCVWIHRACLTAPPPSRPPFAHICRQPAFKQDLLEAFGGHDIVSMVRERECMRQVFAGESTHSHPHPNKKTNIFPHAQRSARKSAASSRTWKSSGFAPLSSATSSSTTRRSAEVCKLHGDEPTTLDDARKRCITLLGPGEYGVRMRDRTQNVVHFCLHGGDTHVMKGRVAFKGEEGLGVDHQVFGRVMEVPHIVLRIITTWS